MIDNTLNKKTIIGSLSVNTTDTATVVVDASNFFSCDITYTTTALQGAGAAKYTKISKVEISDDNFTTVKAIFNTDEYFNSSNQLTALSTPLLNTKLTVDGEYKALGLRDPVVNGGKYIKFYFVAGTNASTILYAITLSSPKELVHL